MALVGPSGSGKTTLARLMARFWDPDQGQVLFGKVDARQIQWPRLMRQVAFVFQDAHLFSGTIAENIAMGAPEGRPPGDQGPRPSGPNAMNSLPACQRVMTPASARAAYGFPEARPSGCA